MTDEIEVTIERVTLTDGSHVFNIRIGNAAPLAAVSEDDAEACAEAIRRAIGLHTLAYVSVLYGDCQ